MRVKLGGWTFRNFLAITQDNDLFGHLKHLGEFVADEDHSDTFAFEHLDDALQAPYFLFRERRCGFVHDNELRLRCQRAADRN